MTTVSSPTNLLPDRKIVDEPCIPSFSQKAGFDPSGRYYFQVYRIEFTATNPSHIYVSYNVEVIDIVMENSTEYKVGPFFDLQLAIDIYPLNSNEFLLYTAGHGPIRQHFVRLDSGTRTGFPYFTRNYSMNRDGEPRVEINDIQLCHLKTNVLVVAQQRNNSGLYLAFLAPILPWEGNTEDLSALLKKMEASLSPKGLTLSVKRNPQVLHDDATVLFHVQNAFLGVPMPMMVLVVNIRRKTFELVELRTDPKTGFPNSSPGSMTPPYRIKFAGCHSDTLIAAANNSKELTWWRVALYQLLRNVSRQILNLLLFYPGQLPPRWLTIALIRMRIRCDHWRYNLLFTEQTRVGFLNTRTWTWKEATKVADGLRFSLCQPVASATGACYLAYMDKDQAMWLRRLHNPKRVLSLKCLAEARALSSNEMKSECQAISRLFY
ncbi:unnamed protein product, partial [Mesorhabditis spiculigera]